MILLWLLIVPLAAGPLAFLRRRRAAMEMVNLAAFARSAGLAVVLAAAGTSDWHSFAVGWISCTPMRSARWWFCLTAFVALVCSVYAVGYFRHDESNRIFQDER